MTSPDYPPPGGRHDDGGSLRPTSLRVLVVWALVGLVAGWLVRPAAGLLDRPGPIVTWGQPAALLLVAVITAVAAWTTYRAVHVERRPMLAHQGVNRLVMARACALVGALVAGAYAGYALSWLGLADQLAGQRALRSGLAAIAAAGICGAGLMLERACRVPQDDPAP